VGQKDLALNKIEELLQQTPAYIPALQLLADYHLSINNIKEEEVLSM
jgi:hypothetical protein